MRTAQPVEGHRRAGVCVGAAGPPSGGTFELTVTLPSGSQTTGSLAYDATASDIQNAIGLLVGGSNVAVVGESGYFMLNFSSSIGAEAVSIATSAGDVIALSNVPTPHLTDAWVSYKDVGNNTYTFTLSWDQTPFQGSGQTSDIVNMYYSTDDANWVDWGWTYGWAGSGPVTLPQGKSTYYFRIQAEGLMGVGAISNTAEYAVPTGPPPTPNLTYLGSDEYDDGGNTYSEYEVFWDSSPYSASPDSHDSMYVYYSADGENWTLWGTTSASAGGVEVSGLTAGQTYYFRVQAENIDTSSGYSNVLSG